MEPCNMNVTSLKFYMKHIVYVKNYVNFDVIILSEKCNITGIYKSAIPVLKRITKLFSHYTSLL